jgi:sugar fermentation stimulation protein A
MTLDFTVPFQASISKGIFHKRYKRFLADVTLEKNQTEVVHVANPGSMTSCIFPEQPCLVSHHPNKKRKLPYSLEAIQGPTSWIGVNTHNANVIAKTFLTTYFNNVRSEIKMTQGWRTDFVVSNPTLNKDMIIEVKNISLKEGPLAAFPDAITTRGQKHLSHMLATLNSGKLCGLLLIVQRTDCTGFTPAHWIDPTFSKLFWECLEAGLWLYIFSVDISPNGFKFHKTLPLVKGRLS